MGRGFVAVAARGLAIAGSVLGFAQLAAAQGDATIPHVGILALEAQDGATPYWDAFRDGMRALVYSDGKTVVFDYRWANHKYAQLPELAAELVKLRVRIIVAEATPAVIAARSVTSELPIVAPLMADPVGSGFAQSLARPGGNITGLSTLSADLAPKLLELLSEIVPSLSRVGMMWDQNIQSFALTVRRAEAAAKSRGFALEVRGVRSPDDLEPAFAALEAAHVQALIMSFPAASLVAKGDPALLAAEVARRHLPAAYPTGESVAAGGLVSYGPSYPDLFRRIATYVDKILKGAKPSDLPVEEPRLFELRVNLKTAKALGVTIPPAILVRADQVIE